MTHKLDTIIKYNSESSTLDYKKIEYPLGNHFKRNEILKDISAFANHPLDTDKHIIIGVKEKNGIADEFFPIERLTDEAIYQQFVEENIEPKINFEYKSAIYNGNKIAYFRIFNNKNRPYLFKKDIQNPKSKEMQYRKGDGFIKVGSSTRKIDRNDLEDIYKIRYSKKDRKNDLIIEPYFKTSFNPKFIKQNLKYLDIKITNISNKSIDFDVEMKIFKANNFVLKIKDELEEQFSTKPNNITSSLLFTPKIPNLDIVYEDSVSYAIVQRVSLLSKTAIHLPQNSSEKDIFCKNLFIVNGKGEIKTEVTIRCDDFIAGAMVKEIIFFLNP